MQKFYQNILNHFQSLLVFQMKTSLDDILNIDGIGETQLKSVKNFFNNKVNINILQGITKNFRCKRCLSTKKKSGLLNEKTFMVTGKLNGISRAEVKSLIEENSGSSVSTVTKKLDYLIIGDKPTKNKVDKAKELKINILNQSQFLKMLNITS
jgi:DNA ligase (NAD+)